MNINKEIKIYHPTKLSNLIEDEIISPFTIVIFPKQAKSVNGITYNIENFFINSGLFVDYEIYVKSPADYFGTKFAEGQYYCESFQVYKMIEYLTNWYLSQTGQFIPINGFVYSGINNFSNFFIISLSHAFNVIFIHEDYFDINKLESYMNFAYSLGNNFYFDTGLSINKSYFEAQVAAVNALYNPEQRLYLFGAVNTPINTKTTASYTINHDYFNVFISANYFSDYDYKNYINNYENNLGYPNGGNIKMPILQAVIPTSFFYTMLVYNSYKNKKAYKNIVNKTLTIIKDGIDVIYRYDDIIDLRTKSINGVYIKNNIAIFITNDTTKTNNILRNENIARLALDVARDLISLLQVLLGENRDTEYINSIVSSIKNYIYDKYITMSDINMNDFDIRFEKTDNGKIKIDLVIRAPNYIEEINILSVYY